MHKDRRRGLVILHVAAQRQWLCAYACTPYAAPRRAEKQGESGGREKTEVAREEKCDAQLACQGFQRHVMSRMQ